MKKFFILAITAVMAMTFSACQSSCERCNKIAEMQAELASLNQQLYTPEAISNEGSTEYLEMLEKRDSLKNQIDVLIQHDCDLPPEKVKNIEYTFGSFIGTYSGEMKANVVHGKGVFEGTFIGNSEIPMRYEGEFAWGELDGQGVYETVSLSGVSTRKEGEFKDNSFVYGIVTKTQEGGPNHKDEGEFRNEQLYNGKYTITNASGQIIDCGTYENGVLTYSAKEEQKKENNEKVKDWYSNQANNIISDIFDHIF